MYSSLDTLLTIKPTYGDYIEIYGDNNDLFIKTKLIFAILFLSNLQAAIHWVYCASDSHLSHRSDIPSAEGTESLIPYLKYQVDRYLKLLAIFFLFGFCTCPDGC